VKGGSDIIIYSNNTSPVKNLPPISIGNKKMGLFVKVNPPLLTTDNRQDAYMQFRLFDANNNMTIQHVTYEITVTKGMTQSSSANQKHFCLKCYLLI
jgi:hypothetical protein